MPLSFLSIGIAAVVGRTEDGVGSLIRLGTNAVSFWNR